ncbi:hypothetical protein [Geomonas ferrireducens]|uniref:hypothetical protein n=1 Tax=Geomonas ferrireducens TaxID=2570227 RepID=UPI0010A762A6|nr:hypothetical protein [Geomonas ferrireducens]
MTGYGLDYGNPVGSAIGAYTAIRASQRADKEQERQDEEFQQRKAIANQEMSLRQEANDREATKFNDSRLVNEGAALQAEMRSYQAQGMPIPDEVVDRAQKHLGNAGIKMALAYSAGAPTPGIIDRAFATGTVPEIYRDPKFTDLRKAEIDKAMVALGDLLGPQGAEQQPQQSAIAASQQPPLSNVERRRSPLPPAAAAARCRIRPATGKPGRSQEPVTFLHDGAFQGRPDEGQAG